MLHHDDFAKALDKYKEINKKNIHIKLIKFFIKIDILCNLFNQLVDHVKNREILSTFRILPLTNTRYQLL